MEPVVLTTRVTAAALLLAIAGGCGDDGYTGPCNKEEQAVAREVAHPKGMKVKFSLTYDEDCVADLREDQAEAALKHYKQQLPKQGWELREGNKNLGVFSKGSKTLVVRHSPGPKYHSYIMIKG